MESGVSIFLQTLEDHPWTPWTRTHLWLNCGSTSILSLGLDHRFEHVSSYCFFSSITSLQNFLTKPLFPYDHNISMAPPKTSLSTLQVPGKSSTRTLWPASPSRTQPGFIITPNDSWTAITRPSSPVDGLPRPGSLSHRPASPRPPPVNRPGSLAHRPASPRPPPVNKSKPASKGKVSQFFKLSLGIS